MNPFRTFRLLLYAAGTIFAAAACSGGLKGISLNEHELVLEKGGNEALEVVFNPKGADDTPLTWVSSDESIATVTDGIVVGVAPGTTEVIVKAGRFTDKCTVEVVISAKGIGFQHKKLTVNKGQAKEIKPILNPPNATERLIWQSSDEKIATVENGIVKGIAPGTVEISVMAGEHKASCTVKVPVVDDLEAVNLGLSVRWASFNLGAESPEDAGDYFAWGETRPKTDYSWDSYKFGKSDSGPFSKYNTETAYGEVDGKTTLDAGDDAARARLGRGWRIPTEEEFKELLNPLNCNWEWTRFNGVEGYRVTSRKKGFTDKWIFLPAAGIRHGMSMYDNSSGYWSSTLYKTPSTAYYLFLSPTNAFSAHANRHLGQSVRAVRK